MKGPYAQVDPKLHKIVTRMLPDYDQQPRLPSLVKQEYKKIKDLSGQEKVLQARVMRLKREENKLYQSMQLAQGKVEKMLLIRKEKEMQLLERLEIREKREQEVQVLRESHQMLRQSHEEKVRARIREIREHQMLERHEVARCQLSQSPQLVQKRHSMCDKNQYRSLRDSSVTVQQEKDQSGIIARISELAPIKLQSIQDLQRQEQQLLEELRQARQLYSQMKLNQNK